MCLHHRHREIPRHPLRIGLIGLHFHPNVRRFQCLHLDPHELPPRDRLRPHSHLVLLLLAALPPLPRAVVLAQARVRAPILPVQARAQARVLELVQAFSSS